MTVPFSHRVPRLSLPLSILKHLRLRFRTCSAGEFVYAQLTGHWHLRVDYRKITNVQGENTFFPVHATPSGFVALMYFSFKLGDLWFRCRCFPVHYIRHRQVIDHS